MPKRNVFPYPNTAQTYYLGGEERTQAPLPERPNYEPATPLQALMEAAAGTEPYVSLEERQPIREAVQRAVDRLDPDEKEIVEAIIYEGIGFRGVERRMGVKKSTAHRKFPQIMERLKELLLQEPLVARRVGLIHSTEVTDEEDVGGADPDVRGDGGSSQDRS